jgi:predicted ribosome quality control (RQC) complex YloA/Tae2 family protein
MKIKFDIRKSFFENLEEIHNKIKKLKRKIKKIEELLQKEESKPKIIVIRPEKKRKKDWYEKFRWCITPKGNIIIGGRDAKQNEILVKKYFDENDLYFHADIKGASSVIFKNPDLEEIDIAGKFAVIFSSAWEKNLAVKVIKANYNNVSLSPPSGEYREKGGIIIREREYIGPYYPIAGIGWYKNKIMCAPPECFEKCILIAPGTIEKGVFAREISKILECNVEDVLSVLPSGKFKILEKNI